MLIVESQSMDVYRNLAIEEYLMDHMAEAGPVLFLWRSACAVVVGKNQNPWRECRLDLMRKEGVPMARRISGGGAVYHDAGNLNYCVIVDRTAYREDLAYKMVCDALVPFGIRAQKSGKSNLCVDGLKFSGNAFCFRKGRALHHGTLLLDTDIVRLNRYLGSMFEDIDTHAIPSVPAKVTNLGLGVDDVARALTDSFRVLYGSDVCSLQNAAELDGVVLRGLCEKHVAKEWMYGATPKFRVGTMDGELEVVRGEVVGAWGAEAGKQLGRSFSEIAISLVCPVD